MFGQVRVQGVELSQHEMPGLMAARADFGPSQTFKGLKGSLHVTSQTGLPIETRSAWRATVHWASGNIFCTQDHAAAAVEGWHSYCLRLEK